MTVIMQLVRNTIGSAQSLKVSEILKGILRNRMHSAGTVDRDELLQVLDHYKKLQIIYVDADENVLFL